MGRAWPHVKDIVVCDAQASSSELKGSEMADHGYVDHVEEKIEKLRRHDWHRQADELALLSPEPHTVRAGPLRDHLQIAKESRHSAWWWCHRQCPEGTERLGLGVASP